MKPRKIHKISAYKIIKKLYWNLFLIFDFLHTFLAMNAMKINEDFENETG